ncbi:molybdenum ABC transporter ATP-binding protein [Thioclava sp. F1Mire-8]|uniref:molybdenum ABC transporter ATP-binding protein n=2 Tax=unclassified Thioclava TaxID=2621713 RepID=UPI000B676505|nr:molybdenum ABC transporter ATP-binding protein [Thioclava sp. F1Mire-8]
MMLEISLSHRLPALDLDVDFTAPEGVTALFGPSGAGKTTVVNAVAGLLRPDRGRIVVNGEVLLETEAGICLPPHKRRIGYVFQDARLFPHLSVRSNLLYGQRFNKTKTAPEFDHIIDMLGLGALLERRPAALSGGEKSRVALGRAILSNPRMLLMDEPLAALDAARKSEILPYIERLRDEVKLPILYVSHAPAEVARLATSIALIEAGRLRGFGPAREILSDPTLAPALGQREAGAVISGRVMAQEADGLTRIETAGGPVLLPYREGQPGQSLRLRIHAGDVTLAVARPEGLSALNILPVTVTELRPAAPPSVYARLKMGDEHLLARLTTRSVAALGLTEGKRCHAIIKAMSVASEDVG